MSNSGFRLPTAVNEPVRTYAPGSPERESLKMRLASMAKEKIEIPLVIGGKEVRTGNTRKVVMPHSHGEVLAEFHLAGAKELEAAAAAALKAKAEWENLAWHERAAIFLKAADLLAGSWRDTLNAATMLGQSKNAFQAEIDAACELIDFLRFNAEFYQRIQDEQPISSPGIWNRMEWRPLEGFVLAITPFNFTAIAGNLPATPAMLGNTVVWKPSDTQMLAAHYTMKLFEAAGLPPGVINLVAADGPLTSDVLLANPRLAGVHFTGSTPTFQSIWKRVGENLSKYATYPRLVGETGGKDFVFAHPSADVDALTTGLVRGAFEYQGQKCSAASRAYVPASIWEKIQGRLVEQTNELKMGDVRDFRNFVNAVIDERSFKKISGYLEEAKQSPDVKVLAGGQAEMKTGYFIRPTLLLTISPHYRTMQEELFGPVLTTFVYDDAKWEEMLKVCDETSPYALTGAVFAQDRRAIETMTKRLTHSAGNFYVNDKPTGAVVGQQPFGGARASGTNDKAGSPLNLYRWLSPRTIKETFQPPKHYGYPTFLAE
ncbi:MAG: L-glutamate gamma-semialdehyde dehydrogenase [Bdellovibrionales bacterium]|nr:L-glutamate gamma-semialdehyde dehydrogenase [Bdellovibrionales bacterium]